MHWILEWETRKSYEINEKGKEKLLNKKLCILRKFRIIRSECQKKHKNNIYLLAYILEVQNIRIWKTVNKWWDSLR